MKLMVITTHYPPEKSAASVRIEEMVSTFSKQEDVEHITVLVFVPLLKTSTGQEYTKVFSKVDIIYYKFPLKPFNRIHGLNPYTLVRWAIFSIKKVKRYSPDIVIATVPPYFNPAIAAYFSSVVCRKQFCLDIRDAWINFTDYHLRTQPVYIRYPINFVEKVMVRLFLHACKKALLISTVYKAIRDYLKFEIKLKTPIIVSQNGINFSELNEIKQNFDTGKVLLKNGIFHDKNSIFIVYAGELGGYYKPEMLFAPLKRLIQSGYNVKYILLGEGKEKESIARISCELGIEKNVILLGGRGHSEVIELSLAADVAFYALDNDFPNPNCALGTKVLEYIACGLPILSITGEGSIVSELITTYGIGIALKWNNTMKIEDSLKELIDRKEEFRENIAKFYPYFADNFNREKINMKLYQKVKYLYLKNG